jgi:hypothetical protein
MKATATKPLTTIQQGVYDFFSPGCAFTRSDLVRLTRMQGNSLTFPLISLVKRGLIVETQGETMKDAITYTMATAQDETPRMMPGQEPYTAEELAQVYSLVEDAARAEESIGADHLDTIRLITVAADGTEDALAPATTADTMRADDRKPKATGRAKEYRTNGAYRIEGRTKKGGSGTLYVGVWADTGDTMRWQVAGGKNGAYTLRVQADDEAAAIRWAARQFPAATMEDAR